MDFDDWIDREENDALIEKYEVTKYAGKAVYFEMEEFEYIVNYYLGRFEFNKADRAVVDAELCHPDLVRIAVLKSRLLMAQERYPEVITELYSFALSDLSADVHILCAKAYAMLEEKKLAIMEFERACEKESESGNYFALNLSDSFLDSGNIEAALEVLLISMNERLPDFDILHQIAYCYELTESYTESILFYNKCIDLNPFNKDAWFSLAQAMELNGLKEDAISAYDFALTIDEECEKCCYAKASLLTELDRFDAAIDVYKSILEFTDSPLYATYQLAELYSEYNKLEEAMVCYRDLIEINPEYSLAYLGIGLVLLKQGDLENSILSVDRALELEPENSSFLFYRGKILFQLGAMDEAFLTLRKVVEIDSSDVNAWMLMSYLNSDTIDEGIVQLSSAFSFYPEDPIFPTAMSVLYFRKLDLVNSLKMMAQSFELKSDAELLYSDIAPELSSSEEFLYFLNQFKRD